MQVDAPLHLDPVVHDEVSQKDDCNITPEKRTQVMTMFETSRFQACVYYQKYIKITKPVLCNRSLKNALI